MQVLMGPTYNMDVSAPPSPACVRDGSSSSSSSGVSASSASAAARDSNKCNEKAGSSSCLFLSGRDGYRGEEESDIVGDPIRGTCGSDELSDSSSSIGAPGGSEEEDDDEDDVVSSWKELEKDGGGGLTRNKFSMSSLEDSLLDKRRGLSNHYSGKSKSFGNLAEAAESSSGGAKQVLEKEENPFNKRRRILIANRLSRKCFYSTPTHRNRKSMPLLPVLHDDDEEETEEEDNYKHHHHQQQRRRDDDDEHQLQQQYQCGSRLKLMINNSMRYKSNSCFCLADLGEEEEEGDQQQQED